MRKKNTFQAHGSRRGASLLISLGIITIITLLAIGITTVVVSSLRDSSNLARSNEAYYAAEGALEAGLMENATKGAGYSTSEQVPAYFGNFQKCEPTDKTCLAKTPKYEVKGQVPQKNSYQTGTYTGDYSLPSPGTGTAGNNCDPLHPQLAGNTVYFNKVDGKFYSSQSQDQNNQYIALEPEDNPCNWNKIKVGDSVNIPLYYLGGDGKPVNIMGSNSTFELRVRTACPGSNDSNYCNPIDRPKLDDNYDNQKKYDNDDPIITWGITAQDSQDAEASYSLLPYVYYDSFQGWQDSSIITEALINNISALKSNKLGLDSNNCKGQIISFLTKTDSPYCNKPNWINQNISKPSFKLTVIHSLDNADGGSVPYLEYQLIFSNIAQDHQPTDTVQTINAEGFSGSFKQNLEAKIPQAGSVLEYVIQQ